VQSAGVRVLRAGEKEIAIMIDTEEMIRSTLVE